MRSFLSLYTLCELLIGGTAVVRGTILYNWTYDGCWSDIANNRTLNGAYYVDPEFNNWENCVFFCDARSYIYAGVEYGQECYCGNVIRTGATKEPDVQCDMACVYGTGYETCGGHNRLNIFKNGGQY